MRLMIKSLFDMMKIFNDYTKCSLFRTQYKYYLRIFGIVNTEESKYFQKLGSKIKELREAKDVDQKSFPLIVRLVELNCI